MNKSIRRRSVAQKSTKQKAMNSRRVLRKARRHRGLVSSSSRDAIRAAIEGFALARDSGSIKVSLIPADDGSGKVFLEMIDLLSDLSDHPTGQIEESSPSRGAVGPISRDHDAPSKYVEQRFLEESVRSNEDLAAILSQDDMLNLTDLVAMTGWGRDEIAEMQEGGSLLALRGVSARCKYPDWQVVRRGGRAQIVQGVDLIIEALGGDMWSAYHFLTGDFPGGRRKVWKVLSEGRVDEVMDLLYHEPEEVLEA